LEDNVWIDTLKTNSAKLMTDVKMEMETVLRANAREEVVAGIAQGKSLKDVQKTISEKFGVSMTRSKTIAQTELHKSYMKGQATAMNEALNNANELGIKANKVWRHNGIGVPREDHLEADGQPADKDGLFNVGGEEMEAPDLGSDPGNNINCHCTVGFEVDEEQFGQSRTMAVEEAKSFSTLEEFPSLTEWAATNFGNAVSDSLIYDLALPPITEAAEGSQLIPTTKTLVAPKRLGDMNKQELIDYKELMKAAKKSKDSTAADLAYAEEQHSFTQRLLKKITDKEWMEANPSGKATTPRAPKESTATRTPKVKSGAKEYITIEEPKEFSDRTLFKIKGSDDGVVYEVVENYGDDRLVGTPVNLGQNLGSTTYFEKELVPYAKPTKIKVDTKSFGYEKLPDGKATKEMYKQFKDEFFEKYKIEIEFDSSKARLISEESYYRTTSANFTVKELQAIYREAEEAFLEVDRALPQLAKERIKMGKLYLEDIMDLKKPLKDAYRRTGSRHAPSAGRTTGNYNQETKDIRITSRDSLKNVWAGNKNFVNQDVVIGGGTSGNTLKNCIRHEYGHFLDMGVYQMGEMSSLRNKAGESLKDIFEKLVKESSLPTVAGNTSRYATTNEREFFAECFAAITSPNYSMQLLKLPTEVESWFTEVLQIKI
jgi:hypothetical protein